MQTDKGCVSKYTFLKENLYKYRLKHLISGRYVKVSDVETRLKNKRNDTTVRVLGLSSLYDYEKDNKVESSDNKEYDDQTIFQIFSTSKDLNRIIYINSYIKFKFFKVKSVGHNRIWIGTGSKSNVLIKEYDKKKYANNLNTQEE